MANKRLNHKAPRICHWRHVATALQITVLSTMAATPAFQADVETLTRAPHRLTGTAEYKEALDYVSQRISATRPDTVITQVFSAVQMNVKQCEVRLEDGRALPLEPMRPNGILLPVTPPEGIRGPLVHCGNGSPEHFLDRSVVGAIVVLDYNSGEHWLRAFRLGARGVIFVSADDAEAWQSHIVDANVNMPRYFYSGARSDLPDGQTVVIHSEIVWESVVGHNVLAFYKGSDPVFSQGQDEVVVLAAPLDSLGEVPQLSPGARGAANVASLLKVADRLTMNRPRRHMMLAFIDAQSQGHFGISRFYRAMDTKQPNAAVDHRTTSLHDERDFMDAMRDLASKDEPLNHASPSRRQFRNRLQDRATERAFAVRDTMNELRKERQQLQRDRNSSKPRIEEITREVDTVLDPDFKEWNDTRRALGKDRTEDLPAPIQAKLDALIVDVRGDIAARRRELAFEARELASDTQLRDLLKDSWISLHASLMLGDTTPRWGVVIGGDTAYHSQADNVGLYGKIQSVFLRAHKALNAAGQSSLFEVASVNLSLSQTRVLWGAPHLVHSGEVAGLFGINNICLATCQESLAREGTPADTLARLNLDRIEAQADEVATLLVEMAGLEVEASPLEPSPDSTQSDWAVADQEGLSLRRGIVARQAYYQTSFSGETVAGPTVMGLLPGSSIPNTRMAGAIVQYPPSNPQMVSYNASKPYAFQPFRIFRTTQNGTYNIGPILGHVAWQSPPGFAVTFDARGGVLSVSDSSNPANMGQRLNVFKAHPGWLVLPPPLHTTRKPNVRLLSARDNGTVPDAKSYLQVGDGIVTWYVEEREEGVKLFDLSLNVALNSGPGVANPSAPNIDPLGDGFDMDRDWESFPAGRRSALDLWRLNDSRLQLLQGKNIMDSSLAELHGRAEDLLLKTADSPVTLRSEAIETSAFMASRPVYDKTRRTVDDIVFAVLILLALSVPFAFVVERVTVGATTIYKQMSWFALIFGATFVLLFLTHPAFAIANTPIIIFLGFAILLLSLLVISILMQRFEKELKVLQGMPATVHAAGVSRMGTVMAATHMGISTMRRRPLRTALTAVTVILLTFTILSFASFGTQSGVVRLFSAPVPAYSGAFLHDINWAPLGDDMLDVMQGRWGEDNKIFVRRWVSPSNENAAGMLLTRPDGTRPVTVKGLLGISPDEIRHRQDLSDVLDSSLDDSILLTPAVARSLGVSEGDFVMFSGVRLRVGRVMDPVAISIASDMDGSSLLPVDFTEARSSTDVDATVEAAVQAAVNWTSLPAEDVVVVSERLARRLGAKLHAWTVYTDDVEAASLMADDMARMMPVPVAGTRERGVFRHILGTVVAASGAADLIFPIFLGGLVIFGTMLGSVADREREIYTFSALGLAPRHVATLFVAEAIVYSLVGGMGGYLLAQTVLRVMNAMAAHGWVTAPEMNMSSTNTIITILIVMATVLISALYPAVKASKSANPGLMRSWRPPEPKGNVIDLVFPFTVSEYDITGVVSFLKEHFDNHSEVGLGGFMARDTKLERETEGGLGVRSHLTLAPFDLGVSQKFAMQSTPSEIPGIDEVRIILERASGQPKDWQRLNRLMLDDLRQQFLLWRALPEETMDVYRQRTLAALGNG